MSLYSDYISFVDGNSKVPYFVDGAIYVPKPKAFSEMFVFEMKEYYHSYNKYFVGIGSSKFVRSISANEFILVKGLHDSFHEFNVPKKVQLLFDF